MNLRDIVEGYRTISQERNEEIAAIEDKYAHILQSYTDLPILELYNNRRKSYVYEEWEMDKKEIFTDMLDYYNIEYNVYRKGGDQWFDVVVVQWPII
jgi:hypothetical protein